VIVLPAIDLREGACVQLVGGSYDAERIRLPDPVAVSARWAGFGFPELHVVDLDAATGRGDNHEVVAALIGRALARVQIGGGMGDAERAQAMLTLGADRIVVGTRGIEDPAWLDQLAREHPGRIVLAADVREREVVTRGWQSRSGRSIMAVLERVDAMRLSGVLVTAVHQEGRLAGPDVELVREVCAATRLPVQASGGIRSVADLRALAQAGAARAVVGMALYTGALDPEAVAKEFVQ